MPKKQAAFRPSTLVWIALAAGVGLPSLAQPPAGPRFLVHGETTADQRAPSVAITEEGLFLVAWQAQVDGGCGDVLGRRFNPAATPLGDPFQIAEITTGCQDQIAVAALGNGSFAATWSSDGPDGSGRGVFARLFSSAGAPETADLQVNSYTTGSQRAPDIAPVAGGGFVVTWESLGQDGIQSAIFHQRFDSLGQRLGGETRSHDSTGGGRAEPAVAGGSTDDFVIVWQVVEGSPRPKIEIRRWQAGAPQGAEFLAGDISAYDEPQESADVSRDASGRFVVVWADQYYLAGTRSNAARRFDASGAAQGAAFRIQPGNAYLLPPEVSSAADGEFLTVWNLDNLAGSGLSATRWSAAGDDIGDFVIDDFQATGYYLEGPDIAHRPDSDDFVVVWSRQNDEGTFGVYARLYSDGLLFTDGFEDGDLGAWSATAP